MKTSYMIAAVAAIIIVIVVVAVIVIMGQPGNNQNNGPNAVSTNSVEIKNMAFNPTPITVTVGTTVTWTNNDTVAHTVTSTSGPASFDSGHLEPGDKFSFTFTEAGTYDYMCTIHPYMRAQVIVTA